MGADKALDRGLPGDTGMEQAVLGSIFNGEPADFSDTASLLNAGDFQLQKHKIIWYSMARVAKSNGGTVDRVLVAQDLQAENKLKSVDGLTYLAQLDTGGVALTNFAAWAKKLRELAVKRRAIVALHSAADEIFTNINDIETVISSVRSHLDNADSELSTEELALTPQEFIDTLDNGFEQLTHPRRYHLYIDTGFAQLDEATYGIRGGTVWVIGGDTSTGKSALALNIAHNIAKAGRGVLFFSLEMNKEELLHRLLARDSEVSLGRIKKDRLGSADEVLLEGAWEDISALPFYIDDTSSLTVEEFMSRTSRAVRDKGVQVAVLDYLQLLDWQSGRGHKFREERDALSYATRAFKLFAQDHGIPLIIVSQFSYAYSRRGSKDKKDQKPRLSDLHGSSTISKDSDVVLLIHRPGDFDRNRKETQDQAELLVAKNRGGPKAEIEMTYQGKYTTFTEVPQDEQETTSEQVDEI